MRLALGHLSRSSCSDRRCCCRRRARRARSAACSTSIRACRPCAACSAAALHSRDRLSDRPGPAPDHREPRRWTRSRTRKRHRTDVDGPITSSTRCATCSTRCGPAGCRRRRTRREPGMQMSVRLAFKRSGEIIGTPRVTYTSPDAPPRARDVYHDAITAALERCTPMPFTDGLGRRGRRPADRHPFRRQPGAAVTSGLHVIGRRRWRSPRSRAARPRRRRSAPRQHHQRARRGAARLLGAAAP